MTVRFNPNGPNNGQTSSETQVKLTAKSFFASSNEGLCQLFLDGHQGVLRAFGLEPDTIQSFRPSWFGRSDVVVCMFFDYKGKPVSGVRLHKRGEVQLPFEVALRDVGIDSGEIVKNVDWEICGLWNDVSYSGELLSYLVAEFAMSIFGALPAGGLVYNFASSHTDFITSPLGFKRCTVPSLQGDIPYPDDRYITRVLIQDKMGWLATNLGQNWSESFGERVFWNGKREIYLTYDYSEIYR